MTDELIPGATGEEVKEDDFIKHLRTETDKDNAPPPPPPPPGMGPTPQEEKKSGSETVDDDPDDDDDDDLDELSDPALLVDLAVEGIDLLHNMAMQWISGEPNPDLFKAPKDGKKRIKKVGGKLAERYKLKMHPGFILVVLFLVVYGPNTMKAFAIKKQKAREKKIKAGEMDPSNVEIKKGPGRPPGSTNKDKK